MGTTNSTSSGFIDCLNTVCADRGGCIGTPNEPFYQSDWVKPYNLDATVTPVAVVKPDTSEDVSEFVKCAVDANVQIQGKSGGHSYANFGLGGTNGELVIDLSNFQDISLDAGTQYAHVGAGMRLGDIDKKLIDLGDRAFAHGICPGVGIGGHATIGGLGPMSRMWGAALDHIMELEVVTANGTIVRANDDKNSDIFWAMKGAAAGFGIITEFVMKTHPAPGEIVQYTYDAVFGSQSEMVDVLEGWQTLVKDPDLDRRFGSEYIMYPLGTIITGTFYGSKKDWDASGIEDRLPKSDNTTIVVNDWLASLAHDAEKEALYLAEIPTSFYSKSIAFRPEDALSHSEIDDALSYVDSVDDKGTLVWFVIFDASGGAVADPAMNATAYAHRDKFMFYQSYAIWIGDEKKPVVDFLEGFHKKIAATMPSNYTVYPGYVDPELENAQQRYWSSNLPRLEQIKSDWDPQDVFHNPQAVRPK